MEVSTTKTTRKDIAHNNLDSMRSLSSMSGPDRSSMASLGSRNSFLSVPSSRVTSMMSDPRSSIASTDSSFTHYSAVSSRLSTASSRLSTISNNSAPKNFACTFCDKALKSKPYWKSHEEEFHEQRLTWRCPDCEQIFHAGKRFREHHTKLHVGPILLSFCSTNQYGRDAKTANSREKAVNQLVGRRRHA
jgi:hypothetical protein